MGIVDAGKFTTGTRCVLLTVLLLASSKLVRSSSAASIQGQIVLPEELDLTKDAYITLFTSHSDNTHRRRKTFPDTQGSFEFEGVEDGVHSLDVEANPFYFTTVKLLIKDGVLKEALASDVGEAPMSVDGPLKLAPLRVVSYFEQKQGFDIMRWLKTPYGMMIGFAIFSLVVMPYLKVDPEEYREMRKELSNLTGGRERSKSD